MSADDSDLSMPRSIDAYVKTCPAMSQQLMARALSGTSRSPRDAIKAKCLSCSGFVRQEAASCMVRKCPLWAMNPYRKTPSNCGPAGT